MTVREIRLGEIMLYLNSVQAPVQEASVKRYLQRFEEFRSVDDKMVMEDLRELHKRGLADRTCIGVYVISDIGVKMLALRYGRVA